MNPTARWLKLNLGLVFLVLFFARVESYATRPVSSSAAPADSPKPAACTAREYRQFDFWVGDWDAFDFDNPTTKVARTQVDLILDGCVLRGTTKPPTDIKVRVSVFTTHPEKYGTRLG
jgi:hypothetical protein